MWQGSFGWEGISYSKYGCFLCKIPVQRTDGLSFVENIHCSVDFHKNPTCGALERSDGGDWCWDQIGAVKAEQGHFPQASFIGDVLHQNSNWRISSQDWSWKLDMSIEQDWGGEGGNRQKVGALNLCTRSSTAFILDRQLCQVIRGGDKDSRHICPEVERCRSLTKMGN